jgi:GNS1/SUR4 family
VSDKNNVHELRHYDIILSSISDPRIKDSFWYGSPFPVISLALVYWVAIRHALPKFMENREPLQLKTVLQLYNLLQISLCIALLWRVS